MRKTTNKSDESTGSAAKGLQGRRFTPEQKAHALKLVEVVPSRR